jgi:hypothetical protein
VHTLVIEFKENAIPAESPSDELCVKKAADKAMVKAHELEAAAAKNSAK